MSGLDCMATEDREFEIDLEGGDYTSEYDLSSESDSTSKPHVRKAISRLRSGFLCTNGSINRGCSFDSSSNSTKLDKLGVDENVELLIDKSLDGEKRRELGALAEKKKNVKEMIKNNGKLHKPPRPPRGPSLDAADRIFVKEMTQLAVKKRAMVERIKALKKMKAEKTSSFNSNLPALFITLLFFVVIILQGMSANGSAIMFESPVPSSSRSAGLIPLQHSSKSFPNVNILQSHILDFAGEASSVEDLKNHSLKTEDLGGRSVQFS
ncbi:uncharacterized protein LOC111493099 [Cucurbita maxima]|uniref:Uncharacterized protein LOC111493099 n=1 Tax=Cucurbita maxima TaxID=3661 RepID=A0A6J1KGV9_CUCMA|nr:uncharacterized protein LOC111493099 [Cucurbita maxima]XP_022998478.1 uncharacterized protein LOC111493099 [Cucurbita maxima]